MENISTSLQQFLDGSLSGDQEAELLHRLSVSPERRDLLRSYMKQQTIINADRSSIVVPYSAEQKLWAAISTLSPVAAPVISEAPTAVGVMTGASTPGAMTFWKVASVAVVALFIGLGSGYYLWSGSNTNAELQSIKTNNLQTTPEVGFTNPLQTTQTNAVSNTTQSNRVSKSTIANQSNRQLGIASASLPELASGMDLTISPMPVLGDLHNNVREIPYASALFADNTPYIREPKGDQRNRPSIGGAPEAHSPSVLERFEFVIHEGIGKQFPNTSATNISMPIITNSDISVKYQLTPEFWIGGSFGTANVTQKKLYVTFVDPNAPQLQYQITSDLIHQQTVWGGGLVEYRKPITGKMSFAANLGLAASTLGPIISSELGVRYDVTGDVGVLLGLRGSRINSNVAQQYQDIITSKSFNSGTGVAPGVTEDKANINLEISTGIYFHF